MIRLALLLALALTAAAPAAADNIKDLDAKWMKAMKDGDIATLIAMDQRETNHLWPAFQPPHHSFNPEPHHDRCNKEQEDRVDSAEIPKQRHVVVSILVVPFSREWRRAD